MVWDKFLQPLLAPQDTTGDVRLVARRLISRYTPHAESIAFDMARIGDIINAIQGRVHAVGVPVTVPARVVGMRAHDESLRGRPPRPGLA